MKTWIILMLLLTPMNLLAGGKIHPELPEFPAHTINIMECGAQPTALSTHAINEAITTMNAQGGGTVVIPRGTWTTGPIQLLSNVNLHLDEGALLIFSRDVSQYPVIETIYEGERSRRCQSPIWADHATNIAITGQGIIDGSGDRWRAVKHSKVSDALWADFTARGGYTDEGERNWYPDSTSWQIRPVLLHLENCNRVLLEGVKFQNSPAWCLHPLMCQNLTLDGISVYNPEYAQNGDGVDLESCNMVEVKNSHFDAGDDAICIKSGRNEQGRQRGIPSENIYIHDCQVKHGHGGIVVGSEMSGGVRNVWAERCVFDQTDTGLRFKSTRGRGGVVENIHIRNIEMHNIVGEMITMDLFYFAKDDGTAHPVDETTPIFRNIDIRNIQGDGAAKVYHLRGLPEMPLQNISIKNVKAQHIQGESDLKYAEAKLKNVTVK